MTSYERKITRQKIQEPWRRITDAFANDTEKGKTSLIAKSSALGQNANKLNFEILKLH